MNYTNGSARGHVNRDLPGGSQETVLSLEMTKRGLRLCVRKPATISRRPCKLRAGNREVAGRPAW